MYQFEFKWNTRAKEHLSLWRIEYLIGLYKYFIILRSLFISSNICNPFVFIYIFIIFRNNPIICYRFFRLVTQIFFLFSFFLFLSFFSFAKTRLIVRPIGAQNRRNCTMLLDVSFWRSSHWKALFHLSSFHNINYYCKSGRSK